MSLPVPGAAEALAPRAPGALRQRVRTALLLAPPVMLAVLLLPTAWFAVGVAGVLLLAAWEWARLAGVIAPVGRLAYVLTLGAALVAAWWLLPRGWDPVLCGLAALWWLGLAVLLARIREVPHVVGLEPGLLLAGLLVLVAPWLSLVHLHGAEQGGPPLVLTLLLLIWFADSAAYFAGRRFGRRKLAPVLSPGKTWAGVWGALAAAALWGVLIALVLGFGPLHAVALVAVFALTAAVSIVGDLYESLLKRRRGLKDAGALLPGHGGMLDRIDSTTAAAPLFAIGLLWLLGA